MRSSPIVTVNMWWEGPVMDARLAGLVGDGPLQWVFDKSAIFGERAGHVSAVVSGAEALAGQTNEAVAQAAVSQLHCALPRTRGRRLHRAVVVREPRATFSLAPGAAQRPATVTPLPGFFLAGDWTDTGLPGTIESAVISGHAAATAALAFGRS
jgi:zeta-carotene desaturase